MPNKKVITKKKKVVGKKDLIILLLVDIIFVFLTPLIAHHRTDETIIFFGMEQLIFLPLLLLFYHQYRHPELQATKKTAESDSWKVAVFVFAIIGAATLWGAWLGPAMIRFSLDHHGQTVNAKINYFSLIKISTKTEWPVSTLEDANAMAVSISFGTYGEHSAKFEVEKAEPAFGQIYEAAQNGALVPIRYLPAVPSLVRPQAELDTHAGRPITPLVYPPENGTGTDYIPLSGENNSTAIPFPAN